MEAKLKTDQINYLKKISDVVFTHEETAEIIVPDAMPDIIEVVDAEGTVILRSKEAESGRLTFSGMVSATVIYQPEDGSALCRLELSIPFSATQDVPEVTAESQLCAALRIGSLDARMINSRKALVRADVVVESAAYAPAEIVWADKIEDDDGAGIELLRKQIELNLVTQVREKSFVLADEFAVPSGRPPIEEILKTSIDVMCDDVKAVGNKLIFKGNATIRLLYTGGSQEPITLEFSAPFSQIMEMEGEMESVSADIRLMLTNCYVENGSSVAAENAAIAVEMHMVAQAICREMQEILYISDVYSTRFDLTEEREPLMAESEESPFMVAGECRESAEVSDPVQRVLDINFKTGKAYWTEENGAMSLRVSVGASALFMSDAGKVSGVSRKFEVSAMSEMEPGVDYQITAHVQSDAQAIPAGNGVEFRIPVHFHVRPCRKFRTDAVSGVRWDEEQERDLSTLPSIVVHHVESGENLWMMAKKYCSTEELIQAANNLEPGASPERGQLFIIPKKR